MTYPIFNQRLYPEELGLGEGTSIAGYGCSLVCVASICRWFGKDTNPSQLNVDLIRIKGFANNGFGNLNLIIWGKIAQLYSDVLLEKNLAYPTTPADMTIIDSYLARNLPVVVGVSFKHNTHDTLPTHYVVLYRKNSDGTYQMMDPWFGDSAVFDTRYAVNTMTVAQCILQVVAYSGPAPTEIDDSPPHQASAQQALSTEDQLRLERDRNWNMYLSEVDQVKVKDTRIVELESEVTALRDENTGLKNEIKTVKERNGSLAQTLADMEKEDATAIDNGMNASKKLEENEKTLQTLAQVLKTKPTEWHLLSEIDKVFSRVNFLQRVLNTQKPKVATQPEPTVLDQLGL